MHRYKDQIETDLIDPSLRKDQDLHFVEYMRKKLSCESSSASTSTRPSAALTTDPPPFGYVDSDIQPLVPAPGFFSYENVDSGILAGNLYPDNLTPPPPVPAPIHTSYPISPLWTKERDPSYLGGWCYLSSTSTLPGSKFIEKERMNSLVVPPELKPRWNEDTSAYVLDGVPGMVQMIPGITYAVQLDGDPDDRLFVAALQTPDSLRRYPKGEKACRILDELSATVWGDPEKDIPPLYAIEGLKRNDRSAHPDPTGTGRFTGSYSMGSTIEQGWGPGRLVPALQPTFTQGLDIIHNLHAKLSNLYAIVAEICLPKREYDLIDFHHIDNNVFSLGGLLPSAISIQMNVSLTTNATDIANDIGPDQGKLHVDKSDHIAVPTMFAMFFRLPKGKRAVDRSDPGPFLLGRPGLYCHELGEGIFALLLMFSGRDMHSGTSPWIRPGAKYESVLAAHLEGVSKCWPSAELITRVGLVAYQSTQAVDRNSAVCVGPESRFGNHGTIGALDRSLNYTHNGFHLLGSEREARSRLAWEHALGFLNGLSQAEVKLDMTVEELMQRMTFRDAGSNETTSIVPYPMDPSQDTERQTILMYRRFWKHLYLLRQRYLLPLTKHQHKVKIQSVKDEIKRSMETFTLKEFYPVLNSAIQTLSASCSDDEEEEELDEDSSDNEIIVSRVLDRRVSVDTSEICWLIEIFGTGQQLWTSERKSKKWLFTPKNQPLFLDYLGSGDSTHKNGDMHSNQQLSLRSSDSGRERDVEAAMALISLTSTPETSASVRSVLPPSEDPSVDAPSGRLLRSGNPTSTSLPGVLNEAPVASKPPVKTKATKRKRKSKTKTASKKKARRELAEAVSSESASGSESESASEIEWEIDYIIGHEWNDKTREWRFMVKWHGAADDTTTASITQLQSCDDLYQAYLAKYPEIAHNGPLPDITAATAAITDTAQQRLLEVISPQLYEDKHRQLDYLYSLMSRKDQRAWPKVLRSQTFYSQMLEWQLVFARCHTILGIAPLPIDSNTVSNAVLNRSMQATLLQAASAAQMMPVLQQRSLADEIENAALNWEMCRSYMVIHEFVTHYLPRMADILFDPSCGVASDGDSDHFESSSASEPCPALTPLVDHIRRYITARSADYRSYSNKRDARSKTSSTTATASVLESSTAATASVSPRRSTRQQSRRKVPVDGGEPVVGKGPPRQTSRARPKAKDKSAVDKEIYATSSALLEIPPDVVSSLAANFTKLPGSLYLSPCEIAYPTGFLPARTCFIDTILDLFIVPSLRETPWTTKTSTMSVLDRVLVRGAIIAQIVKAAGTEAVCVSPAMAALVKSSQVIFNGNRGREDRLWSAVRRQEDEVLKPLSDFLNANMPANGLTQEAEHLGDFIRHHFLEFCNGRYISEDEYYRNWLPPHRSHANSASRGRRMLADGPVVLSSLLPDGPSPSYGVLGLIVREAVNKEKGWETPASEGIRRCLLGRHPKHNREAASFSNPDHMNPFRHLTVTAALWNQKLPSHRMTGSHGLSNLLTFMGTGQGYATRDFLASTDGKAELPDSDRFFCGGLDASQALFEAGVEHNMTVLESQGRWSPDEIWLEAAEDKLASQAGFNQVSDPRVWGQTNQILSLRPKVKQPGSRGYMKLGIADKLRPYWSDELQKKWVEFLGPMFEENPATYTGSRHTFLETLHFVQSLGIDGFRSGLTSYQTVVNLCFKKICMPLTLDELTDFISCNTGLGAYNGLIELGFNLTNRTQIRCALAIVHDHLSSHLCPSDADLTGFSSHPFVLIENTLCKVSRYINRVEGIREWGKDAEAKGRWKAAVREATEYEMYPIGMHSDLDRIKTIVAEHS